MPVQVPIQQRRIKWLVCKMLSAAGVLETDEFSGRAFSNQVAASSSDFAPLTAFI